MHDDTGWPCNGRPHGSRTGRRLAAASLLLVAALAGCRDTSAPSEGDDARFAWTHREDAGAAGQPYVDADVAVFTTFTDSAVVALDARTGAVRWETHVPTLAGIGLGCFAGCFPGTNMVASSDVIVVPAGNVYALDRTTGAVRWTFARSDDFPGLTSVAAANGLVYTAGTRLYALDATTGALVWQSDLGGIPFRPVVDGGVVYVETQGTIGIVGFTAPQASHATALDARTGALLWSYPFETTDSVPGGSLGPAFVTPDLVIVAGVNGRVYALDRATGQPRWIANGSGPYGRGAVVVDGTVIAASAVGKIDGFDLTTGELRWRRDEPAAPSPGGPTVPGQAGPVLVPTTTGNGVALISRGWVVAVESDGTVRWRDGGAGFGGPVYSTAATYMDGVIYIGSRGSQGTGFYALRVPVK